MRDGYTHIAILVTDSKSNQGNTSAAAIELHAANIYREIYAVGVNKADVDELHLIASEPSLVFFRSDFDSAAISSLEQNATQMLIPCIGTLSYQLHNKIIIVDCSIYYQQMLSQ